MNPHHREGLAPIDPLAAPLPHGTGGAGERGRDRRPARGVEAEGAWNLVTQPGDTLVLPAGWHLVSSLPREVGWPNDRYEDGRGNWIHVMEWGAPDGSPADVFWWLEWNAAKRAYRIKTEGKPCKKERCEGPPKYQCGLCEVGDEKFHGYAKADEDGPNISLHFGK